MEAGAVGPVGYVRSLLIGAKDQELGRNPHPLTTSSLGLIRPRFALGRVSNVIVALEYCGADGKLAAGFVGR